MGKKNLPHVCSDCYVASASGDASFDVPGAACPPDARAGMIWAWRWRRAARMTPAECLHRLREAFARRLARARRFGWEAYPARGTLRQLGALVAPLRQQADTLAPSVKERDTAEVETPANSATSFKVGVIVSHPTRS